MWDGGPGFGWMLMLMALFWGGTLIVIVWTVRQVTGSHRKSSRAIEILEERYARGEINREEFESKRQDLEDR
jgi:putative membrane protein